MIGTSMPKICVIGDTHFARKAEHPLMKKYIKDGQLAFFDHLINELNDRDIKTVLFTGDIHDTRNSINVESLINTHRLFKTKMSDFDIHIILGNHDMYYENNYDITALELFEDLPNVTVYRNGVKKSNFLNKNWYIFPWIIEDKIQSTSDFLKKLSDKPLETRDNTVLFGHFEMMGMDMEGGSISTFGMDQNLFSNACKLCISGHYHGKSITTKGNCTILYTGSPYAMTFANANQEHGVWIINEDLSYEFIENSISPKFCDIYDIDDIDSISTLENCFVRLWLNNSLNKEHEFEIRLKIENKNPLMIRIMPYSNSKNDNIVITEVQRDATKVLSMDTFSLSEIYIKENDDTIPTLSTHDDPVKAIMDKVRSYKETIV